MVEENGEGITRLEDAADGLSPLTFNGQPDYAEADDPLDDVRSSSLSDLEDGADEVEMVSVNVALSRQLEAESEAETERLEISPHKNQNHDGNEVEFGAAAYPKSPSNLAHSAVPQVAEQELFSDSVVSSPGPSDEDLESELRSEHSAASANEDNVDAHIRDNSPRKRKHLDIGDDSGSEDNAAEDARRRRRRTESVRSDAEGQSELGLSREATIEPMVDVPNDADALEATSNILRNARHILKSKGSKAVNGKHGKAEGREPLKNIVEEGEDRGKRAEPSAEEARAGTDGEEHAEGEDEDVETIAKDEEECKTASPQTLTNADNLQTQRRWQQWTLWPLWRNISLLYEIGSFVQLSTEDLD